MKPRYLAYLVAWLVPMCVFLCPAQAAEFTADMSMIGGQGFAFKGKVFVKEKKIRMETVVDGEEVIVIQDLATGSGMTLNVDRKIYVPYSGFGKIEKMNQQFLDKFQKEQVGAERINGYHCDKFVYRDGQQTVARVWVSRELDTYVRRIIYTENAEARTEFKNIREKSLDDSLFRLPPGYARMDTSAPPQSPKAQRVSQNQPKDEPPSQREKGASVDEFEIKGEGRDTDLTNMDRAVDPAQSLTVTITGASRYGIPSKGKFSLYRGTEREKIQEVAFTLEPEKSKTWRFSREKQIRTIAFGIYGRGEVKVRVAQGSGPPTQGPEPQRTKPEPPTAAKSPVEQPAQGSSGGSFASLVEEAKQHYANGNPLGAIGSLKAAVLSIWEQAPLTVQNVRLVKDTKSYALRENNLYRSGEPVYISCEIVGHRLNRVGQTYQIHITTDFEVLDPGGKILGGQKDVFKFKNVSPIPNTEFYLNLTYRLTGAPKGAYDILTTVHDRQSGKQAKFKTRIRLQ